MKIALQRKKECNVKAQTIVEELIEPIPIEKAKDLKVKVIFDFIYTFR